MSVELCDHEIITLEKALERLNAQRGGHMNVESFRKAMVERFALAWLMATLELV